MTPYSTVFQAFLGLIEDEYYMEADQELVEIDLNQFLNRAIFQFPYCKIDLSKVEEVDMSDPDDLGADEDLQMVFEETLTNGEIQVLATLMKKEWVKRKIATLELMRQKYSERDFQLTSQAAHLRTLLDLDERTEREAKRMLFQYSRSQDRRPSSVFSSLATKGGVSIEQN